MRQRVRTWEHFRRGNACLTLIVARHGSRHYRKVWPPPRLPDVHTRDPNQRRVSEQLNRKWFEHISSTRLTAEVWVVGYIALRRKDAS
jgi:hypothetical protein